MKSKMIIQSFVLKNLKNKEADFLLKAIDWNIKLSKITIGLEIINNQLCFKLKELNESIYLSKESF